VAADELDHMTRVCFVIRALIESVDEPLVLDRRHFGPLRPHYRESIELVPA